MSIGRAQAQLLRDRFLDNLGSDPPAGELPIIEEILGMAGKELIDIAVANLDKIGSVSTGGLATDLTFSVVSSGNTYELSVGYPKGSKSAIYWDFNNKGVQGVNKPGNAPNSPYKFRYMGVSKRHALAILKWYRSNGKAATNIHPDHPVSPLETKRKTLLQTTRKPKDTLKTLAYATAMKMKIEGLKPSAYFDDAVKSVFGPDLIDALQVALGGEVIMNIRKYGDNI